MMTAPDGNKMLAANIDAPAIRCTHASLKRSSTSSDFRSFCPTCNHGILFVYRQQHSPFAPINVDRCTFCGQTVIYTDKVIGGERVAEGRSD